MTKTDKQSVMDRIQGAGKVTPTLADVLKDTPKSDKREQIEYIDIGQIDQDPNNFYLISQVDELASNIAVVGLQQPIRVRPSDSDPARVIVVSGHRRLSALEQLVKDGREDLRAVPCIREHDSGSEALRELRLIYANSDTRIITPAELAKQAEKVEILLYQLKEEGFEFPGRMRDHVAEACRVSAPKLARLKVIREKLIPGYMELFESNRLPEQTAYALARLPDYFQIRMYKVLKNPPSGYSAEKILSKYNEGWRWRPEMTCPDGKTCLRGDAFLCRDCEAMGADELCGGLTCCLVCEKAKTKYCPCERMCSKAKALRQEDKIKTEDALYRRKQENGQKYQQETQGYAKRLMRAIDAAGLTDNTTISWESWDYHGSTVVTIRQWASGQFDDPGQWSCARLVPGKCDNNRIPTLVKQLNCSADYLMGLTDDIRPPQAQEPPKSPDFTFVDDITEVLDSIAAPEAPVRRICWHSYNESPPVNKPILTFRLTNNGPVYRVVVWDGATYLDANLREEIPMYVYTQWMDLILPGSGEIGCVMPPVGPERQLIFNGWMPGGTTPMEGSDLVADFLVDCSVIREICTFRNGEFVFPHNSAPIDAECIRWMALPPTNTSVEEVG